MKFYPIVLSCLLFSSTLFSEVHAAEWVVEPTLTLGSTYNDNITFRETDEIDDTFTTLDARLNSQIKEQIWGVNLDGRVRRSQYSSDVGSDTNNIFFKLGGNYRAELHSWNLDADFERNTTFDEDFDTQLSANDLDAETEREKISLSPGWAWTMSQAWSLQASLQTTDIKYDEVNSLDLSDSETNSGQLRTKYQLDDVSDVSVSVGYGKTKRDQDKRKSGFYEYENTNYQLSYNYQPSENSTFNIGLGRRNTETNATNVPFCNSDGGDLSGIFTVNDCPTFYIDVYLDVKSVDSADKGDTYSISYDYTHEVSSYSIAFNQSVTTSSNGFAQESDDYNIRYYRKTSETVSVNLILNASRTTSIDSLSASEDRDIIRIEPSISWRFSKDSRLSAGYRYRQQTYSVSNDETESNSIYINLSFFWPKSMSSY